MRPVPSLGDSSALGQLLRGLGYADESRLLDEFGRCFAEYQAMDKSIFELAVENTNLKAQRLSFTSAQQEADAFRDALNALVSAVRPDQASRAQALAATAVAAVREIQVLQAPHIAESDEAAMTRLEKRAAEAEAAARRDLSALAGLVPPKSQPQLAPAKAALDRFMAVNTEIVALSRRNTNVRSLALSLGQKRTLTARCEENLRALQGCPRTATLRRHPIEGIRMLYFSRLAAQECPKLQLRSRFPIVRCSRRLKYASC